MTAPEKAAPILALLPCPFCGESEALSVQLTVVHPDDYHGGQVVCSGCDATGADAISLDGWLPNAAEAERAAIAAWNRAARPSAVEEPAPTSEAEEQDALRHLGEAKALIGAAAFSRTVRAARPDLNAALEKLEAVRVLIADRAARLDKEGAQEDGESDALTFFVCSVPFQADDICVTDIDDGTAHTACLKGSPVVDLNTGEPSEGPVSTWRYRDRA